MTDTTVAHRAVQVALAELNQLLPPAERVGVAVDTPLATTLDSLGIVNLLLAIERAVEADAGMSISLTDLLEVAPANSPLSTVGTLVALVAERMAASRS